MSHGAPLLFSRSLTCTFLAVKKIEKLKLENRIEFDVGISR